MSGMLTNLRKALTTAGDGAALLPYDLDPVLHEELLNLQPLAMLLDIQRASAKTHEYTVRSSHPLGWFEGEATPINETNSVYARVSVQLKIQRIWGSVTGFAQAADAAFIDALAAELDGSVEGMSNIMEWGVLWGASSDYWTGDAYQYTGIIPRVLYSAPGNVVDAGGNKIALSDLDDAIAAAAGFRGARSDPKLWMMPMNLKNVVDGLQQAVQLPLTSAELFDGKLTMSAYSGIPILETDYMTPGTTSPTDLAAVEDDGAGALAADQYFYNISSVTLYGECIAGTEANVTTVGGSDAVDLSWTADSTAYAYMIWRGLATGNANLQLLDVIAAKSYNAAGTVTGTVAAYKDTGALTPKAVKPLSTGEFNVVLINRNPMRGVSFLGLIDDLGRPVDSLFRYVPLAQTKDTYDYMIKGYLAAKLVQPAAFSIVRHAKLA